MLVLFTAPRHLVQWAKVGWDSFQGSHHVHVVTFSCVVWDPCFWFGFDSLKARILRAGRQLKTQG